MISVVIPYLDRLSQGQGEEKELKYAIRSFEKYCKFDFDIVIVGDKPSWYVGSFIPTVAVRGMQFARCFDIANKLNHICHSPIITDEFIYTYDDVYLLNNCELKDFQQVIALFKADKTTQFRDGSVNYQRLFSQTVKELNQDEFYVYETHLPRTLKKDNLAVLYKAYNLKQRPVLFSTLYFNEFHDEPDIVLMERNTVKCGIYDRLPYTAIVKRAQGFKFLNHSEKAYDSGMQEFLRKTYPNKSRFEK